MKKDVKVYTESMIKCIKTVEQITHSEKTSKSSGESAGDQARNCVDGWVGGSFRFHGGGEDRIH